MLGEWVAERGKGVGATRVGEGGGEGGGVKGWGKGVESIFKLSFLQNRYRNFRLGCRNSCYDMKSYMKLWGIPDLWGNSPVMTS